MTTSLRRLALFWITAIAIVSVSRQSPAMTLIPSTNDSVKSLDGVWRFKLEQAGGYDGPTRISGKPWPIVLPKTMEPFQTLEYREDSTWKDLKVPGNWEMAGFSPATYNQPDNAIGLYRLEFDVPAEWKGRIVKINFDGVQNAAEVYLNGQPVNVDEPSEGRANFHQGGWDAFQADLTPVVKFGEKNLLALRVYKNSKYIDLDTGDYFLLGGIHRTVTLFSVPQTHIEDFSVRTRVLEGGKAELRVVTDVASPAVGTRISMWLGSAGASPSQRQALRTAELNNAVVGWHLGVMRTLNAPKLWSAEHPNLYELTIELTDSEGKTIEQISRRVGIREVTIQDGVLLVNHVPVKLTGMCRHDVWPTLGTALNDEAWRKDVSMMKAANINAIRTSHYPYGSGFYDVCDEMGMYVMDEVAACWTPTDTDELTPAFAQHARELARRDKNHPSVIVWAIGNENAKGMNDKVAADELRKIDPTRPRLVSRQDAEEAGVEIDDAHYTNPAEVALVNRQPRHEKYPKTYLENPNNWELRSAADQGSWELWAGVIDRVWREVWDDDHIPGSFEWEWADRAVADQCPTKLYDYFPDTGVNLAKVKGLVDAFRNPRPGVYHVKMAYAPVKVDPLPQVEGPNVTVYVTNYYSFTDLSELKTVWHLLRDGSDQSIASGVSQAALAPRSRGGIKLSLPAESLSQADALRLEFNHPDGRNIATYDLRLKPERDSTPKLVTARLSGINFPRFNFTAMTYANNSIGWRTINKHAGKLINITVQHVSGAVNAMPVSDDSALYAMPLADIRAMDADVVLGGDSTATIAGHVRADFSGGAFTYRLNWFRTPPVLAPGNRAIPAPARGRGRGRGAEPAAPADVQELGWAFQVPASWDQLSWHRHGYWSYYPPDDVDRLSGTATPDSANAQLTRMDRPDAFDFNSTKYHCDWAKLAGADNHGVVVSFSPDARGNVRGGTDAGGKRSLVVNKYCCPPRDISSGVVADEYFTLGRGQTVYGSFVIATCGGNK